MTWDPKDKVYELKVALGGACSYLDGRYAFSCASSYLDLAKRPALWTLNTFTARKGFHKSLSFFVRILFLVHVTYRFLAVVSYITNGFFCSTENLGVFSEIVREQSLVTFNL